MLESRRLATFDFDLTFSLVRARRAALRAGGSAGREEPCSVPSMGHSIREPRGGPAAHRRATMLKCANSLGVVGSTQKPCC